eukprot:scaffold10414_cov97-Skeletonema_dohrnii-CCMP3373.AAC.3
MDNGMKQQLCDMNGTTASQYEDAASASAAANFPHVDSPPATFASTLISWAFQSTLPPVVVPNQHDQAPSPTSVASTSTSMAMTMMQQPAIGWARYSEPHPHSMHLIMKLPNLIPSRRKHSVSAATLSS